MFDCKFGLQLLVLGDSIVRYVNLFQVQISVRSSRFLCKICWTITLMAMLLHQPVLSMPQFFPRTYLAFHLVIAVSTTGYPSFGHSLLEGIDLLHALRLPRQFGDLLPLFIGPFDALGLFGRGDSARGITVRGWEVEGGSRFGV